MKLYNMAISYGVDGGRVEPIESAKGKWATRADAEQAAKDAVEMAHLVQTIIRGCFFQLEYTSDDKYEDDEDYKKAQAIIERYEGGMGREMEKGEI